MVERRDFQKFGEPVELAAGGLLLPATLCRTGVQSYPNLNGDGKIVREYRAPDQVFSPLTLASFRAAPVTLGHPPSDVTPETWQALAVGSVSELDPNPYREDGHDWLAARVAVNRADALADVKSKSRSGLSLGYSCDIDPTPGVTPSGEHYDQKQINIRINHLGLLGSETPRAGSGARLRHDAMKVKINGIEYDSGSDAHVSALNAEIDKAKQREASEKGRADAAEAAGVKLEAERDAALKAVETETKRADAANSDESLTAAAAELIAFRAGASRVLGDKYDFAGKSRHQVRLDALAKLEAKPSVETEEGVRLYFEARLDGLPSTYDYNANPPKVAVQDNGRNDATESDHDKIMAEKLAAAAKKGGL